jgi:hypothetical protein
MVVTIEALKDAIALLPAEDRHSLVCWLSGLQDDAWDKEMRADFASGGRGVNLIAEIKRQVSAGNFEPLSQKQWTDCGPTKPAVISKRHH